jgi:hypothetical protein
VPVGARRQPGCGAALRPMACRFNGGRGSGGDVVSRLARPALQGCVTRPAKWLMRHRE